MTQVKINKLQVILTEANINVMKLKPFTPSGQEMHQWLSWVGQDEKNTIYIYKHKWLIDWLSKAYRPTNTL